eukprot:m.36476 g.36476  ORF g.36476 m.36476 type:complete len:368 (+) comp6673_c0_seq1:133-1236(+)
MTSSCFVCSSCLEWEVLNSLCEQGERMKYIVFFSFHTSSFLFLFVVVEDLIFCSARTYPPPSTLPRNYYIHHPNPIHLLGVNLLANRSCTIIMLKSLSINADVGSGTTTKTNISSTSQPTPPPQPIVTNSVCFHAFLVAHDVRRRKLSGHSFDRIEHELVHPRFPSKPEESSQTTKSKGKMAARKLLREDINNDIAERGRSSRRQSSDDGVSTRRRSSGTFSAFNASCSRPQSPSIKSRESKSPSVGLQQSPSSSNNLRRRGRSNSLSMNHQRKAPVFLSGQGRREGKGSFHSKPSRMETLVFDLKPLRSNSASIQVLEDDFGYVDQQSSSGSRGNGSSPLSQSLNEGQLQSVLTSAGSRSFHTSSQ